MPQCPQIKLHNRRSWATHPVAGGACGIGGRCFSCFSRWPSRLCFLFIDLPFTRRMSFAQRFWPITARSKNACVLIRTHCRQCESPDWNQRMVPLLVVEELARNWSSSKVRIRHCNRWCRVPTSIWQFPISTILHGARSAVIMPIYWCAKQRGPTV